MKHSWSQSSAWAISMRCRASSHPSIPSDCGSSWLWPPTLMTRRTRHTPRRWSSWVFPLLTFYFVWKRGLKFVSALWLALPFAAGVVFANIYPFHTRGDTEFLTALHLPIALWLAVGFAYVRGRWFADGGRMNFVRFSGEWVIYYVLIALGGGVLTSFTFMMFRAIGMNPAWFVAGWLLPCG